MGVLLRAHAVTRRGPQHETNEDAFAITAVRGGTLLVVSDGMGGMGRGDEASRLAVHRVADAFDRIDEPPRERIRRAIAAADHAVRDLLCAGPDRPGCTVALAFVSEGQVHAAWVGDSRVYLVRGARVLDRTRDHKLVTELVAAGKLSEGEARASPLRSVLTEHLGARAPGSDDLSVSFLEPRPLHVDDRLVLCTDGVIDTLEDLDIANVVAADGHVEILAERVVDLAARRGSHDDITAIVATWEPAARRAYTGPTEEFPSPRELWPTESAALTSFPTPAAPPRAATFVPEPRPPLVEPWSRPLVAVLTLLVTAALAIGVLALIR